MSEYSCILSAGGLEFYKSYGKMKRKVILHYHIFKNAGTSIDRMLRESYAERWINYDKADGNKRISPAEMEEYILDHPDLVAISSHQVVPPLPDKYLDVYPLIMIRHPIDRAYSAYLFEWKKQLGKDELKGSFGEYIVEKFKNHRGSAIEDFQVMHLANRSYSHSAPAPNIGDERLLGNARKFISDAGYFGIVDRYNDSLKIFEARLAGHFPELKFKEFHENRLQEQDATLDAKIRTIMDSLDKSGRDNLIVHNLLDFRFYEYALSHFERMR